MSSPAVEIALITLAMIRELNLAYFRLVETEQMTAEEREKLRAEFMAVNRALIPKPEDLK